MRSARHPQQDRASPSSFRSVRLDPGKCVGCSACLPCCPTGAIRMQDGWAVIVTERCIDCGECVRACPRGAKLAVADPLPMIHGYRRTVAIPAPALYGQFEEAESVDRILSGLLELGFDEVFEIAEAAELVGRATDALLSGSPTNASLRRPLISSACPAVVRIVQARFPRLAAHLVPLLPPMEAAARLVKGTLHRGEPELGVFFITPCAGKVGVTRAPLGYASSAIDGVIGFKEIFSPLRAAIARAPERKLSRGGRIGFEWLREPGHRRAMTVHGLAELVAALEALERDELEAVDYIEALACSEGCAGGPLAVEEPSIARARIRKLESGTPSAGAPRFACDLLQRLSWTDPPGLAQHRCARIPCTPL